MAPTTSKVTAKLGSGTTIYINGESEAKFFLACVALGAGEEDSDVARREDTVCKALRVQKAIGSVLGTPFHNLGTAIQAARQLQRHRNSAAHNWADATPLPEVPPFPELGAQAVPSEEEAAGGKLADPSKHEKLQDKWEDGDKDEEIAECESKLKEARDRVAEVEATLAELREREKSSGEPNVEAEPSVELEEKKLEELGAEFEVTEHNDANILPKEGTPLDQRHPVDGCNRQEDATVAQDELVVDASDYGALKSFFWTLFEHLTAKQQRKCQYLKRQFINACRVSDEEGIRKAVSDLIEKQRALEELSWR